MIKRSRYGAQVSRKLTTTKWFAEKRSIEYTLPRELAENLIVGECHYCGQKAQNVGHTATRLRDGQFSQTGLNGIDRVDSSRAYTPDNVVSCCCACNRAKSDMTTDEFKEWLQRAYNHMFGAKS